jgi:hypothetical protein
MVKFTPLTNKMWEKEDYIDRKDRIKCPLQVDSHKMYVTVQWVCDKPVTIPVTLCTA